MSAHLARPAGTLPGRPDAIVDLQTPEGVALVEGQWRYADADVVPIDFVSVGDDLGPSGPPNRTLDVVPAAGAADFDDSRWRVLEPQDTMLRLGTGRVCFSWYRIAVTLPERIGQMDVNGATVVFECVVDDMAEVWVDGRLPITLGDSGGHVVAGFNAPNRVVLTRHARPGQRFQLAVFGINGPISLSPRNYIWLRTATLDVYRPTSVTVTEPVAAPGHVRAERVATGLDSAAAPVWAADGALLLSSPGANTIYRWTSDGVLGVFRPKSGYAGVDIGRHRAPGPNGLAFDPRGRLTICQHGNRQVLRVEPRGNTTVVAAQFRGRRLNSPHSLAYSASGVLYLTDPPLGLPDGADDAKRELPFSGVFAVRDGRVELVTDALACPTGIALSPDDRWLYVTDVGPDRPAVMRFELDPDGRPLAAAEVLHDLTGEAGSGALAVDDAGRVYVGSTDGVLVVSSDGDRRDLIRLPHAPTGLAFGGPDRCDLYVTSATDVYRVRPRHLPPAPEGAAP